MIKSELIAKLAKDFPQIPEKVIADSVNLILDDMTQALGQGGRIEIRGFGSFSVRFRPPRNAHNPRTGEKVLTEPKYTPHFKPGKEMRERINANRERFPIKQASTVEEDTHSEF